MRIVRVCKRVLCYTASAVLLTLITLQYKYSYFIDSHDHDITDSSDNQLDEVVSRVSNSETMFSQQNHFAKVTEGTRTSGYVSYNTDLRREVLNRYVLVWNYWEQLTMATNNMFSLVWFCQQWNARLIMPFTQASRLYGLWKRWDNKATIPLNYLYNHSQFNSLLEEYHLPPLVSIEKFLLEANRSLIMLQFFYYGDIMPLFSALGGSKAEVISGLEKEYVFECGSIVYMKKISSVFLNGLNERAANPFSIKACYCVNASHAIYPDMLAEIIAVQDESNVSIVFNNWRGISGNNAIRTSPQGNLKNFRMFVPGSENAYMPHSYTVVFPYSNYVRRSAVDFIHFLNGGTDFGVVHLRSEKLGQRDKRINNYFAHCWEEVTSILQSDVLLEYPNITVLYFTDYGLLGSSTCLHNCIGAEITDAALTKDRLTVSHFDPAKFNAPMDSGFVALVEQSVMAMSRFLVLVGGGTFQTQIRQRFKSQPTAEKGYAVCWEDKIFVNNF